MGNLDRRAFLRSAGGALVLGVVGGVGAAPAAAAATKARKAVADFDGRVPADWMAALYDAIAWDGLHPVNNPGGRTPGRAARIYAYAAVALHESLVDGMPDRRPVAVHLNAYPRRRRAPVADVDWPSAASAAMGAVADELLSDAHPEQRAAIRARFDEVRAAHAGDATRRGVDGATLSRSATHGQTVARTVLDWAAQDGYVRWRDEPYLAEPSEPWHWERTPPNFGPAIDPHWGRMRTFALPSADACAPEPPHPFSTQPGSLLHDEALEVVRVRAALTQADRDTAIFWRDNPQESGLPSGHWTKLVSQIVQQHGLRLDQAADLYAVTNVALADAFISCWYEKYTSRLLRPITYIRRHVEGEAAWSSFVNTPAFPEHTSGHSVASQAAATVLEALLGPVAFVDASKAPAFPARAYARPLDAAREAAESRLLGGIHYRRGIEVGLVQGEHVGREVLRRLHVKV